MVGVLVDVAVSVAVFVAVSVADGVNVGVSVGVSVSVGVKVSVWVAEGVSVGVPVGVSDGLTGVSVNSGTRATAVARRTDCSGCSSSSSGDGPVRFTSALMLGMRSGGLGGLTDRSDVLIVIRVE